jgi:POT family proton-dependent oligopeptide transporter
MAKYNHLTAPVASERMPAGIPFIVGNEAAERFSFYGMRSILFVFMTGHLLSATGAADFMTDSQATEWQAWFVASAYFFPVFGALASDIFLGKYRTILILSTVYCIGHLSLALMDMPESFLTATCEPRMFLFVGLFLIAVGSGGIKPCVSAHVGDQFGKSNQHLLSKVFGWFYVSINFGAAASQFATPLLLKHYGPGWAFGIPGILMALATFVFWLGRKRFVHIPAGGRAFVRETFDRTGLKAIKSLLPVYLFVAVFWSLFDQGGSKWVEQAKNMDRMIGSMEVLPSQVGLINPVLILLFVPLFNYVVYPIVSKFFYLTPMRKVSIGLFIATLSYVVASGVQEWIDAGQTPHIVWQFLAYTLLTAAEIMISITCLEFSYTQSPKKMKSFIMALYLLSVSAGNVFTALVNRFTQDENGESSLQGATYFWFFTGAMGIAAILFILVALTYRGQTYLQDEGTPEDED